jgi:hypothetical protein
LVEGKTGAEAKADVPKKACMDSRWMLLDLRGDPRRAPRRSVSWWSRPTSVST